MIWRPTYCNCWWWALHHQVRYGGSIRLKWTRHNRHPWLKWPHMYWLQKGSLTWLSYCPIHPVTHILPPPLFKGRVLEGLD